MLWRPAEQPARALCLLLLAVFAVYLALYAVATLQRAEPFRFGDFFALWSYGRLLADHPAAELYDTATLAARQVALGMPATDSNPFAYPPGFLFVVRPLGALPYTPAYAVLMVMTLALYLAALAAFARPALPLVLAGIVAPTSTITLVAGQTGFLAGGLLLGGLRLATARPIAGGVLLGLLSYKPQLGLLVPVALGAAGLWRCMAAAGATMATLAVATAAVFGWHIWADWLAYLPAYAAQFDREATLKLGLMPTVTANLLLLGVPQAVTRPIQAVAALAAAAWVWRAFRGGVTPRSVLVLTAATFLASPHGFVYDLPMLTGAALLFIGDRQSGLTTAEAAALAVTLGFPIAMVQAPTPWPISTACLALLTGVLLAHSPPRAVPA